MNLEQVVAEARAELELVADGEVLIVDDGSTDGTGSLADALTARHRDVRVVHHAANAGFSGAMATCFREARGEWVFLAPADGQTRVSEVRRFLAERGGADIVVGIRQGRRDHAGRKALSVAFHLIARALFPLPFPEFSSVFLFRRELLDAMPFRSRPRAATLLPEVLFRASQRGARMVALPVAQYLRRGGRAKGGQLSVALLTLLELVRLAPLVRIDEMRKVRRVTG
jgi:dolichol-phosphate mannosyltransferase